MPNGYLRIHLFDEQSNTPISQAMVRIYQIKHQEIIFETFLISDENGQTQTISLPCVNQLHSLTQNATTCPYSLYNIDIHCDQYESINICDIQIFDQEHSYLQLALHYIENQAIHSIKKIVPHSLWQNKYNLNKDMLHIDGNQQIPHYVYLQQDGLTKKIAYIDYIKNIASSLLYPTWEKAALKAMIWDIMSDIITHYHIGYQQSPYVFQEHRNIFLSISDIVDDVFNEFFVQTIHAHMYSQPNIRWQIQNEALHNPDAYSLLKNQLGAIQIVTSNKCEHIQHSYPGTPLHPTMSGSDILILQEKINIIASSYRCLTYAAYGSGVYDEEFKKIIQQFQHIFFLKPTGITNKSTWYKIMYLAFCIQNSKSPPITNPIAYTTKHIQAALNHVASMYPVIPTLIEDGIDNEQTNTALTIFITQVLKQKEQVNNEQHITVLMKIENAIKQGNMIPTCFPAYPQEKSEAYRLKKVAPLLKYIQTYYPKALQNHASISSFQQLLGITITSKLDRYTWDLLHVFYLQLIYKRR